MLVLRHLCGIAPIERIAVRRQCRIRIRRHVASVSSKGNVPREGILYATADAVGKIHPRGVSSAVELVRETQAPCEIWPPLVLIAEKHVHHAELILVHVRIVGLLKRRAWSLLDAVRSHVTVPHKLKLRVCCERIADERAKTCRSVNSQIVYRHRAGSQRIRPTRFISDKRRHLPFFTPIILRARRSARGQEHQSPEQTHQPHSHSFSPLLPSKRIYDQHFSQLTNHRMRLTHRTFPPIPHDLHP
jgi:hypothetical protein